MGPAFFTFTEKRKVVDTAEDGPMGDIAAAAAAVQTAIVIVHVAAGTADFGERFDVIKDERIDVVSEHREFPGEAPFHFYEAGGPGRCPRRATPGGLD